MREMCTGEVVQVFREGLRIKVVDVKAKASDDYSTSTRGTSSPAGG